MARRGHRGRHPRRPAGGERPLGAPAKRAAGCAPAGRPIRGSPAPERRGWSCFPNAPYIVTDFVHLGQFHDKVPGLFDMMLIAWFAWTGLLLGVVSLRPMQEIVARTMGSRVGWLFVVLVTLAGSIGIYLGRFLRWNSWNVFQAPLVLADTGWDRVSQPDAGELMLGFAILFALLFPFVYATVYLLSRPRDAQM